MATYFLDSVGGNDSNDGTTWANRKATMSGGSGILSLSKSAGDIIKVTHNHNEVYSGNTAWNYTAATSSNPVTLVSVDSTDGSTYQVASGVQFDGSGGVYDLTLDGEWKWIGINMDIGDDFFPNDYAGLYEFENCTIKCDTFVFGSYARTTLKNCILSTDRSTYFSWPNNINANIKFFDCLFIGPNWTNTSEIFGGSFGYHSKVVLEGCDFSDSGNNTLQRMFLAPTSTGGRGGLLQVRNCRLAEKSAGVPMTLFDGTAPSVDSANFRAVMSGCYTGTDTKPSYQLSVITSAGELTEDTTTIRTTDGAYDGTTYYSWSVVTVSGADEELYFVCPLITRWIDAGVSQTVTIYITSTVALDKGTLWVELTSPSEAATATAQHKWQTSKDNRFVNGALTTTSGIWTSAKTNQYKIVFTISPTQAGIVTARVNIGKASATVVIDPILEIP